MQVTYRHKKEPTQWKELRSWKYTFIQLFVLSNSEMLWNLTDLTSVILQKRCWNPEKTTKDFHCTHSCRAGNQITGPQQQWLPYAKIQQPRTLELPQRPCIPQVEWQTNVHIQNFQASSAHHNFKGISCDGMESLTGLNPEMHMWLYLSNLYSWTCWHVLRNIRIPSGGC